MKGITYFLLNKGIGIDREKIKGKSIYLSIYLSIERERERERERGRWTEKERVRE